MFWSSFFYKKILGMVVGEYCNKGSIVIVVRRFLAII